MARVTIFTVGRSLRALWCLASLPLLLAAGCGGRVEGDASGVEAAHASDEPATPGAGEVPNAVAPGSRLRNNEPREGRVKPGRGVVLPHMLLHLVYIGTRGADQAPRVDTMAQWLMGSAYWRDLDEYDVGPGSLVEVREIGTRAFFPDGTVTEGLVQAKVFEELARAYMGPYWPDPNRPRGGEQAQLAGGADAYVFFLPDGVNVALSSRGAFVSRTCADVHGYHRFNGQEPYTVIPPCKEGRSGFVLSHEVVEMATDPIVGEGWLSPDDSSKSGGEIADLCRAYGPVRVDGWSVARIWSNRLQQCRPR